jgi:hypothetical protein
MTVEALSRLETMMETPKTYETDARIPSASLSSRESAVSRIESLVAQLYPPFSPAQASALAGLDASSSIDELPEIFSCLTSQKIKSSAPKQTARFEVLAELKSRHPENRSTSEV